MSNSNSSVLPLEGLQYHFQPSKQHAQYLTFVGKTDSSNDLLHPNNADEALWRTFSTTEKNEVMKTVVRTIVLRVHTGISTIDNKVIHDAVKAKVVFSDAKKAKLLSKAMIYYSQTLLQSLFGYEIVPAVDYNPDEKQFLDLQIPTYLVRLHMNCAGKETKNKPTPLLSTHSAQLMMGPQREKQAAKRGLLMTILSLILNSKDLEISEPSLYRYLLDMDPTLPGTIEGGLHQQDSNRSKGSKTKQKDNNDDDDEPNERHILHDWKTIIRDDFVKNDYLEYDIVKTDDNNNNDNSNIADPSNQLKGYRIGVASRAYVGMVGVYEYNTSLRGKTSTSRNIVEPEIITQDTVGLLLRRELAQFREKLPESRLQAVEREVIGIGDDEEEDKEEEDNPPSRRDKKDDHDDEGDHQNSSKRKKKRTKKDDDDD